MAMALSVRDLVKTFGSFTAVDHVSFDVEEGKFFSILGPSGCGKTTLLRMIAGFLRQDGGTILFDGEDMSDRAPNRRPVNLVFQNLALFPMMNVFENVAFGLRRRGERGPALEGKVRDMLERVGLPEAGRKRIDQLSGGQRQRIAIARCLVLDPTVLLLDEPLGALDAKLREHMKIELKALQAQVGTTFVYITHDQSEALVMSDAVAVMNGGRFEQIGTPQELYRHPKSSFVAQFVGSNNRLSVRLVRDGSGRPAARYGDFDLRLSGAELLGGTEADLFIRPEAVEIEPDGSAFDVLRGTVRALLFDGGNSRLLVRPEGTDDELLVALPQTGRHDAVKVGDSLRIGWIPSSSRCFEKRGR